MGTPSTGAGWAGERGVGTGDRLGRERKGGEGASPVFPVPLLRPPSPPLPGAARLFPPPRRPPRRRRPPPRIPVRARVPPPRPLPGRRLGSIPVEAGGRAGPLPVFAHFGQVDFGDDPEGT